MCIFSQKLSFFNHRSSSWSTLTQSYGWGLYFSILISFFSSENEILLSIVYPMADDVEEENQRMFCWFLGDIEFKM